MPRISFVIPTRDRAAILGECLAALAGEAACGIPFEVIVVDDGSRQALEATVHRAAEAAGKPAPAIRLLRQEASGPASARNLGVAAAQGELIGFLGDDILVEPGYVRAIVAAYDSYVKLKTQEPHGILGFTRYRPDAIPTPFGRWLDARSEWQFTYRQGGRPLAAGVPVGFRLFYTANLLVPRQVLLAAGGFNPGFRHAAYEDTELGYRLAARGFQLYYCPTARAWHVHPASVRGTAARMALTARATFELRALQPALFDLFYPRASVVFGRLAPPRRLAWWLLARPGVALLAWLDSRWHCPLPEQVYRRTLGSVRNLELARRWREL